MISLNLGDVGEMTLQEVKEELRFSPYGDVFFKRIGNNVMMGVRV